MKKYGKLPILISVLVVFFVGHVLASDVVVIKSNDIKPYNQAIEGFRKELKGDIAEYDLQGKQSNVSEIMAKVVDNAPKLIFALGALAAVKAKESMSQIPIIYTLTFAPESKGLLADKNLIGIRVEVSSSKQLLMFRKVVPGIRKVGVLYSYETEKLVVEAQKISGSLGIDLIGVKIRSPKDVPVAVNQLIGKIDALWLIPDYIIVDQNSLSYLLSITLKNKLPFMAYSKNFVKAGALLSPALNYVSIGQQAGIIAKRVFEKKDLPVAIFPPAGVTWAVNLHVAEAINIQVPAKVLSEFEYIYK